MVTELITPQTNTSFFLQLQNSLHNFLKNVFAKITLSFSDEKRKYSGMILKESRGAGAPLLSFTSL